MSAEEILAKVEAQGTKVRELKTAKADKATIDAAVKELLDLKAQYTKLTGQAPPAAAPAPKPAAKAAAAEPAKTEPKAKKEEAPKGKSEKELKKEQRAAETAAKQKAEAEAREAAEPDISKHLYGTLPLMQSSVRTGWLMMKVSCYFCSCAFADKFLEYSRVEQLGKAQAGKSVLVRARIHGTRMIGEFDEDTWITYMIN